MNTPVTSLMAETLRLDSVLQYVGINCDTLNELLHTNKHNRLVDDASVEDMRAALTRQVQENEAADVKPAACTTFPHTLVTWIKDGFCIPTTFIVKVFAKYSTPGARLFAVEEFVTFLVDNSLFTIDIVDRFDGHLRIAVSTGNLFLVRLVLERKRQSCPSNDTDVQRLPGYKKHVTNSVKGDYLEILLELEQCYPYIVDVYHSLLCNAVDKNSSRVIKHFVEKHNIDIIRQEHDLAVSYGEYSPIGLAYITENYALVRYFIRQYIARGYGVNVRDYSVNHTHHALRSKKTTLLGYAVFIDDFDLADDLIAKGASVFIESPIIVAMHHCRFTQVEYLLNNGISIEQEISDGYNNRKTVFMCAVESEIPGIIRYLLEKEFASRTSYFINTVLFELVTRKKYFKKQWYTETLEYIMKHGNIRIGYELEIAKFIHRSLLGCAIQSSNTFVVNRLIDNTNINLGIPRYNYRTPLEIAINFHSPDIQLLLMELGAKINFCLNKKLLECVMRCSCVKTIRFLVDAGADVNTKDSSGCTPLMLMCSNTSKVEVMYAAAEYLLECGADANALCDNGSTPLICATDKSQYELVRVLLQNGAKIDVLDNKKRSALSSAITNNASSDKSGNNTLATLLVLLQNNASTETLSDTEKQYTLRFKEFRYIPHSAKRSKAAHW